MTELKWNLGKVGLKKAFALLVMCLCVTSMGMNAKAAGPAATGESAEAENITLSKTSLNLKVGETATLAATITPDNAADKTVTWSSNHKEVATVDQSGKVTAKANGHATIIATTANGKKATCNVEVTTDATGIGLNKTSLTLQTLSHKVAYNNRATLTATVLPATTSDRTIKWTSSNTNVAMIRSSGNTATITARGKGTTTITATTANGKKATCKVTVLDLQLNESHMNVQVGKSATLKISSKYPAKDTVKSWKSSNTKVATVNKNGKITAKKTGVANITVNMKSGAKATCQVWVTDVKLEKSAVTIQVGKRKRLTINSFYPTSSIRMSWKSSNTKVATVNNTATITAKKAGTAYITVTTSVGATATCKVTVVNVVLKKTSATLKTKESTTIQIKSKYPKKDTVKSYKSSNTNVATVNSKGKVTAKKTGTATITVTMKSGATATFKVTVKK